MIAILTRCAHAPIAYPLTTVYAAGVVTAVGVAADWFKLTPGLVGLTFVTVMVFIAVMRDEVEVVHGLVNGQRDLLLARIDTLVDYLIAAGVALPPGEKETKEQELPHE